MNAAAELADAIVELLLPFVEAARKQVVAEIVDGYAEETLCPALTDTLDSIRKKERERTREVLLGDEAVEAATEAIWPQDYGSPKSGRDAIAAALDTLEDDDA